MESIVLINPGRPILKERALVASVESPLFRSALPLYGGLFYLWRFDKLGAYRILPETGIPIPSDFVILTWLPGCVLAQRELERERFPLVSIPPFGRGFSRHRYDH